MIERDRKLTQPGQPLEPTTASAALSGKTVRSNGAIAAHKEWSPLARIHHSYEGQTYKFAHLEPHTETFVRPATKDQPSETFTVDIRYSDHCFTRSPTPGENFAADLVYRNGDKKIRLFCPKRNEMSKLLPGLIRSLPERKPQHNGSNGNFFTIYALDLNGDPGNTSSSSMWEGWKAGIVAFHAFHTLSFPWPVLETRIAKSQNQRRTAKDAFASDQN